MNNIFEKNINALSIKDSELAKKIVTHNVTDVPKLVQENGFYNLFYKNTYLHNIQNPLQEAQEIFSMAQNEPVAIHFIYGLGLGYLFQVAALNSKGTVILYEPDLNILKIAFTLVDFSNDILKSNVFIADTLEKCSDYIHQKSNTKNTPLLLSTNSYRKLDEDGFNNLVKELQGIVGSFLLDLKYTKERFYTLAVNTLNNIPSLINDIPLAEFKDKFLGKTAVIVSAGPTLDRNIETIKKYRDKIVLFVVGTAAKSVIKHNIKPDFVCVIESYDCSKQLENLDLTDVNFITEPYSHNNLRKFNFKNTYLHMSSNLPVNSLWSEIAGVKTDEYISKGTVSYMALNCARILGCKKLVLVGQDLAYLEGQCYSKNSAYKDLECRFNKDLNKWEIVARNFDEYCASLANVSDYEKAKNIALKRLSDLNNSLYLVKGINGDMIPTESVYAAFIKPLTEFTKMFEDRTYINTSMVGAQIDGFENMPLEKALSDAEIIDDRNLVSEFKYDLDFIKNNLASMVQELDVAIEKLNEGQKYLKSLKNDIARYKNITVEVLKSLKKLSVNYLDVSYTYTKQSDLFDYITTSERINLDYEMKMTKELNYQSVSNIAQKLFVYYDHSSKRAVAVKRLLERIKGEL